MRSRSAAWAAVVRHRAPPIAAASLVVVGDKLMARLWIGFRGLARAADLHAKQGLSVDEAARLVLADGLLGIGGARRPLPAGQADLHRDAALLGRPPAADDLVGDPGRGHLRGAGDA